MKTYGKRQWYNVLFFTAYRAEKHLFRVNCSLCFAHFRVRKFAFVVLLIHLVFSFVRSIYQLFLDFGTLKKWHMNCLWLFCLFFLDLLSKPGASEPSSYIPTHYCSGFEGTKIRMSSWFLWKEGKSAIFSSWLQVMDSQSPTPKSNKKQSITAILRICVAFGIVFNLLPLHLPIPSSVILLSRSREGSLVCDACRTPPAWLASKASWASCAIRLKSALTHTQIWSAGCQKRHIFFVTSDGFPAPQNQTVACRVGRKPVPLSPRMLLFYVKKQQQTNKPVCSKSLKRSSFVGMTVSPLPLSDFSFSGLGQPDQNLDLFFHKRIKKERKLPRADDTSAEQMTEVNFIQVCTSADQWSFLDVVKLHVQVESGSECCSIGLHHRKTDR